MLNLDKYNFVRMAQTIGNTIENTMEEGKNEFKSIISNYKFGFIATLEAEFDRDLSSKEISIIHNKFFSKEFVDDILFYHPNTYGALEEEEKRISEMLKYGVGDD